MICRFLESSTSKNKVMINAIKNPQYEERNFFNRGTESPIDTEKKYSAWLEPLTLFWEKMKLQQAFWKGQYLEGWFVHIKRWKL